MPFVCTPIHTTDPVLGSSLQVTDLFPHKTQSNATVDPRFQGPMYIYSATPKSNTLPKLDVDFDLDGDASGLSAYLLASLEEQNANVAPTPAQAKDMADKLLERLQSGLALDKDSVDSVIVLVLGVGNALDAGASNGDLTEVLNIISGYRTFTIPSGTSIAGAQNAYELLPLGAFFSYPSYSAQLITEFSATFKSSARNGQISRAIKRKDESGASAPLLVLYNDDGTLFE